MSLIESALQRAKKVVESEARPHTPAPSAPSQVPDEADPQAKPMRQDTAIRAARKASCDSVAMEQAGVVLATDDSAADRAYRILRTRVLHRMRAENWHSVGVTAAGVGEGKTVTSINLALSLAREGDASVILVDMDLTRPSIASYLGLRVDKGVGDFLAGDVSFDEVLYDIGVDRLTVVPNVGGKHSGSELTGSRRIRDLCAALASELPRPIVIFDLPPIAAGDDVLKFAPNLDCTLLVVSEGGTSREVVQQATTALESSNLMGVVLNRSSKRGGSSYYYY